MMNILVYIRIETRRVATDMHNAKVKVISLLRLGGFTKLGIIPSGAGIAGLSRSACSEVLAMFATAIEPPRFLSAVVEPLSEAEPWSHNLY